MSKYSCFVLCAMAVSLSKVFAAEEDPHPEEFKALVEECAKLHGHTDQELIDVMNTGSVAILKPCFWGCAFTKAEFLDSKGQYDLASGLVSIKKYMKDPHGKAKLEKIARQCESVKDEAVSDGEAGCERGTLAAACFMEQLYTSTVQ